LMTLFKKNWRRSMHQLPWAPSHSACTISPGNGFVRTQTSPWQNPHTSAMLIHEKRIE
jgi:hypothetical protein